MAKGAEFGSIPDDVFGLVVGLYTSAAPGAITDQNRIDGLAALARAEHAAANPDQAKNPSIVSLTMLCIEVQNQMDSFKNATQQTDRDNAVHALKNALVKLAGLFN